MGATDYLGTGRVADMADLGVVPPFLSDGTSGLPASVSLSLYSLNAQQYSPYLRSYATTLTMVSFSKIDNADDDVAALIKKIWNSATGQD